MKLQPLIKKFKLDWVDSDITDENFPQQDGDELTKEYKLYHFDKEISSENAITEMEKDGYKPATARDLLNWKDWNGTGWVVSLGSFWRNLNGSRDVLVLNSDDSRRKLNLGRFEIDWNGNCRFLAVKQVFDSDTRNLEPSESLGLLKRVEALEAWKAKVVEAFRK